MFYRAAMGRAFRFWDLPLFCCGRKQHLARRGASDAHVHPRIANAGATARCLYTQRVAETVADTTRHCRKITGVVRIHRQAVGQHGDVRVDFVDRRLLYLYFGPIGIQFLGD